MIGSWGTSVRCKLKHGDKKDPYGDGICYCEVNDKLWVVVLWDGKRKPDILLASKVVIQRLGEKKWCEIR